MGPGAHNGARCLGQPTRLFGLGAAKEANVGAVKHEVERPGAYELTLDPLGKLSEFGRLDPCAHELWNETPKLGALGFVNERRRERHPAVRALAARVCGAGYRHPARLRPVLPKGLEDTLHVARRELRRVDHHPAKRRLEHSGRRAAIAERVERRLSRGRRSFRARRRRRRRRRRPVQREPEQLHMLRWR